MKVSLKIGQQKLLKLRGKKKDKKIGNIKKLWGSYKRCNVCVKGPKGEREQGNIFKVVRAEDFILHASNQRSRISENTRQDKTPLDKYQEN